MPGVWVPGAVQQLMLNGAAIGPLLAVSLISGEGDNGECAGFTGAFGRVLVPDLTGQGWQAEVLRFDCDDRI